ncbi:hypothetical protein KCU66_g659, partial [Aureobasidium melanogenum]
HHHNLVDAHVSNNDPSIPVQSVRGPGPDSTPSGAIPLLSLQGLDDTNTRPIVPAAVYYDDRGNKTLEGDLVSIIHILSHVKYCATIKKLVSEYYDLGQAAIVPRCLVLPAISDLERIQEEVLHLGAATDDTASRAAFLPVAERVWRATKSKIDITPTTSLEEFRSHYTGANLRVETIGLISAIAARAARVGLFPNNEDRHNFLQAMFQCSARCVHLARELATEMNDVIVWLSYENLRVTTSIQGYAGANVWRRLGDVSTDLLALEAHREAALANVPFFLAECRRRIFAAAYDWDKFLATLFGRPPRILSSYADCRLPLELTNDQLSSGGLSDEEQASFELTGGWATENFPCSASYIRAIHILAQFKEQALLHHLKTLDSETRSKLEEISHRCKQAWDNLPKRLHYDSACWKSDLGHMTCLKLAEVYLTYLQTQFYIHRLLTKGDASCSPHLVQTCSSLIELSLEIGGFRSQSVYDIYRNFRSSTILCYGLPGAITLVNALKTARDTMSRAKFADLLRLVSIRRLHVFVSLLENVYRPEEANYAICVKASGLISRAMDGILEYLLSGFVNNTQQPGAELASDLAAGIQNPMSVDDAAGVWQVDTALDGITDWDAAALMDMNDWMEGIDWTNSSHYDNEKGTVTVVEVRKAPATKQRFEPDSTRKLNSAELADMLHREAMFHYMAMRL